MAGYTTTETGRMRRLFVLLVSVLVVMMSTPAAAVVRYCPPHHNVTGDLSFVDKYPKQPDVQTAVISFFISCCSGDRPHVNTSWYKWMSDTEGWCVQSASEPDCSQPDWRHTNDDGQTLVFEDPGTDDDSGRYLCNATDGQTTISRTFDVLVVDCESSPQEIKFRKPSNPQVEEGETFVQQCEGDFGCHGAVANGNLAWWSYLDKQGDYHNISVGKHGRYSVNESVSRNQTNKSAKLTIQGVTEEDFERTFVCTLQMRNVDRAEFSISLIKIENRRMIRKYIPLIVALCSAAVVVVVIVLMLTTVCRPIVVFKFKSTFGRLQSRSEDHVFDAMLVSWTQTDVENTLKQMLKARNYAVYSSESVSPGQSEITPINDMDKCASVIFILSKEDLADAKHHLRQFDLCFSATTKAIFIPTQTMTKSDWEKISVDGDYKKVYTHIPLLCTVAAWPGEEGYGPRSWLRRQVFWSELRSLLPEPKSQEKSSEEPSAQTDDTCIAEHDRSHDHSIVEVEVGVSRPLLTGSIGQSC